MVQTLVILKREDNRMTEFGRQMLEERYLLKGEKPYELFQRVAKANADDLEHENRLTGYMRKEWFMPATPVLSNSGNDRGLPISCFLNEVEDSKEGIFDKYNENFWLGAGGGGIGTDWSAVREINAPVSETGVSSGIVPFLKVSDSSTSAVSQGGLRRASQAVYLDVSHPEIQEFVDLRTPNGADLGRRCLNIHHGVKLTDEFMQAVLDDKEWKLISPKDDRVVSSVSAFELMSKILTARVETGEPYIFYSDNANKDLPLSYVANNLKVKFSNLCTEIMQNTEYDKTAVCALSSPNLAKWDEWKDDELFIADIAAFLDNVLDRFVEKADKEHYKAAIKSVLEERNIGIGAMGFHTYLQNNSIAFESREATQFNYTVFKHIREKAYAASVIRGAQKGYPKLASGRRNNLMLSVAPTSSISIICGESSAGIEPLLANTYSQKNNLGTTFFRNPALAKVIQEEYEATSTSQTPEGWIDKQWKSIIKHEGSVQHLEWMSDEVKAIFKTAYEIDQRWIIEHASVRQEFIDQGQSVNIFLPGDVSKQYLFDLHILAWKKGLKSLYYCRSTAPKRAVVGNELQREVIVQYDECLSCQ